MKQDIRDLFKNEDEENLKQLPDNHRAEFLEKLKKPEESKRKTFVWLSIAAVLLIAFTIGFNVFNSDIEEDNTATPIIAQIETIEAEYLANIETEWQSFIALANDENLVKRFRKKLDELDEDYKEISIEFKEDSNNIMVIEALVDNLQTRLQILKDIQKHIKILNQTNEHHENTI
jgi:CHASE3 domain sensor protein